MEKQFSYRIVKIGGKAVAVALTALGLMAGGAHAAEVLLGTSYGQITPDDMGTRTGARWHAGDYWDNIYNPSASYSVATSRAGDIFYGNTVTYSGTDGSAYNVYPWGSNPVNGGFGLLDDSYPWIAIDAQRAGTFMVNTFGNIADGAANNYYFGVGTTVGDFSRGSKAYAYGTYYTTGGDANGGDGYYSINVYSGAAAGTPTASAIHINGVATFDGDNRIDGSIIAGGIYIRGANVNFNGSITAPVYFSAAGAANINGGADLNGSVNFQGYNATLTLSDGSDVFGDITTDSSNSNSGIVTFGGDSTVNGHIGAANARIRQIDVNGNNSRTVTLAGLTYANLVNINTAGNLVIGSGDDTDGLDTTGAVGGRVDFNNTAGTVTLANSGTIRGQIVSTGGSNGAGSPLVANEVNFMANGNMIGDIGSSAANRIGSVNVGTNAAGTVNMTGDLYAVALNVRSGSTLNITGNVTADTTLSVTDASDSTLTVTSGDVTGTVATAYGGQGTLTMLGGSGATANTQVVTGDVGGGNALKAVNSGVNGSTTLFKGDVNALTVTNTGTGTSTFERDVSAVNINVNGGTSNFVGNVTANTTRIGSGVGNFNTDRESTTQSSLVFTGNGTANLNTGMVGNIDFASLNAVVNLSDGQVITGSVTSTGATAKDGTNGVLNFLGAGAITGNIGTSVNTGVSQVNVNTVGALGSVVTLGGNTYAESINLRRNAELVVAAGQNIVGTTATALTGAQQAITTDEDKTGTLTFAGGAQSVTGVVGANNAAIGQINAGVAGATTTFNNMVFADQLVYSGNGTVVLNGKNSTTDMAGAAGAKGLVDFAGGTGVLAIGDGVNLTTGQGALAMANANNATLTFNGNSVVTGVVGGDTANRSTLNTIRAGATGKTVAFADDVHLINAMNVMGDGNVNFANGKSLAVSAGPAATAEIAGMGTINFQGSTQLSADLGVSGQNLNAVNFNTATNNVVQDIARNVYANTVTIGSAAGTTATSQVAINGGFDFAGANRMFAFNGGTTANIANVGSTGQIALGDHLVIANDKTAVNFGVAHVQTGAMTTNGGAMSFTVDSTDITTGSSLSASAGSAQVAVAGALTMNGSEKVHVNYVGSLAQNGTYALIQSASGTRVDLGNERNGTQVTDNSFAIDSSVAQAANGSLILTADRSAGGAYAANQAYIQKAGVVGHHSNNAAMVLGGIAAAGAQTGDMVEVIQKIEIDSFGYGDTADRLATQVKRLAPVANASVTRSTMAVSGLSLNAVSGRMAALRGDATLAGGQQVSGLAAGDAGANKGFWIKGLGASNKQDQQGSYDGYSSNISGLTLGMDHRVDAQLLLGGAVGLTKANITQADFRAGDTNSVDSKQLMGYGTYNFSNELFMDGALSYASNGYTGIRTAAVGRTAKSDFNGSQWGAYLGLGYGFDLGNKSKFTPMASVDYTSLTQDAYTETGAGAINLAVGQQTAKNTRVGLGGRLSHEWTDGDTTFRPEVALNWYRNSTINNDVTASFVGGGSAFVTPGTTSVGRNSVGLGLGMTILSGKTSSIQIRYDLDKSTGFTSNAGSLLARWQY